MPNEPWKKWKKPWNRPQCERRYIEGEKIGLRQLATESGQPKGTIERWCKADDWVGKRGQFQDELKTKTQEKTIEKLSERLSDAMSVLSLQHLESHKLVRGIAVDILKKIKVKVEETQNLEDIPVRIVNAWSIILTRHIDGERKAAFLDNLNLSSAIERVVNAGFVVSESRPGALEETDEAIP
jgi:hypothetical protein